MHFGEIRRVVRVFVRSPVADLLSGEMATDAVDFLSRAVDRHERMNATLYNAPVSFMKPERRFVKFHQRGKGATLETTSNALEDVLGFVLGNYLK